MIQGVELAAWERLCFTLSTSDAWHVDAFGRTWESLSFSQFDKRAGGSNRSRIDRCYVDERTRDRGGTARILASTTLSDHA